MEPVIVTLSRLWMTPLEAALLALSSFMRYSDTMSRNSKSPVTQRRTLWVANPTRSKAWQIRPLAN